MLGAERTRSATIVDSPEWQGRVVVISPHLDDAVFSLGASIHGAASRRAVVDVLTVLAGDPASMTAADDSNRRAGFATAGEAARLRREEDRRACEAVGARPVWLDLSDDANEPSSDVELRERLAQALDGYDAILLPGFPLAHAQHLLVSRLTLEVVKPGMPLGLYVEQPYASWAALARSSRPGTGAGRDEGPRTLRLAVGPAPRWSHHLGRPADWVAKTRGMTAYASQLRVLRKGPRVRILAYEALHRGEGVMWLTLT